MKRSVPVSLTVFIAVSSLMAQVTTTTFNDSRKDPFDIGQNCFFFASAGTVTSPVSATPKGDRSEIKEIVSQLSEAMIVIRAEHNAGERIDSAAMAKSAINGALRSLDPHSNYFDPAEYSRFLEEQRSEYSGIGATIVNYSRNGKLDTYVLATVPGSPAALAKLAFGDRLVKVDHEELTGRPSDEVRDAIRGASGTKLKLTIEKAATGDLVTIELRRRPVSQPSVDDVFVLAGGYGYIRMADGFSYTTAEEVASALDHLRSQRVKGLVLDLRDNPGGILDQAVRVAEKFLPAGWVIVSQRGRSAIDDRVYRSTNRSPETMPLVVLVNEETASASEIVAGALQDHDRALIVGEKTFGKGLVQSLIDIRDKAGLTLTTARYFTPSGRSIQRDYSKGNLYDYFNHRGEVDGQSGPSAHTALNRPVYGGDGIQPDKAASSPKLNEVQRRLVDEAFFFAKGAINDRLPAGHILNLRYIKAASSGWDNSSFNDKLVSDFESYVLSAGGNGYSLAQLRQEREFLIKQIRYNLTLALRGEAAANRILLQSDPPVLQALSQFPKAKELALSSRTAHQQ